jgi:hypothetical protein
LDARCGLIGRVRKSCFFLFFTKSVIEMKCNIQHNERLENNVE